VLEVEQLGKHGLSLFVTIAMLVLVVAVMMAVMPTELRVDGGLLICRLLRLWRIPLLGNGLRSGYGGLCARPLDDLIQFTPVEPYAATLRAVVNLDAATFRHDKGHVAMWAIHERPPGMSIFAATA
jgi:hypothetical protein